MKTSKAGIDLIKRFEGFHSKPYICPAGVATIGYGSTYLNGRKVTMQTRPISEPEAIAALQTDLIKFERIVRAKLKVPVNQNQFDALVSHTYNTGGSDTLFRLVNTGADADTIRSGFETRYITAAGKVMRGLIARRKAEADLFALFSP